MVSLVVGAKEGNHICDTTIVELAITEAGAGGRTWDLTREVVDSIHAGNPHPDAAGHPDVWQFYSQPAAAPPPQPSQPPFDLASPAKTAREFLAGTRREAPGHYSRTDPRPRGTDVARRGDGDAGHQPAAASPPALHAGDGS